MRKIVAVIGDSKIEIDSLKYKLAFAMGKALVDAGYRVQSGGLGGVMEAVFQGAKTSEKYRDGDTIAIVPSFDRNSVNQYADIVIPSGLDLMRNTIVANADAVVAIGGGAGTLSEIALAWSLYRPIVAFANVEGWSSELAGRKLDNRERYSDIDDKVYEVHEPQQAVELIANLIEVCNRCHHGIGYKK